jgi:hypothetical protein
MAWSRYVEALGHIDDPIAAQRLADRGPSNGEPGGRYYHNLGCLLHSNPLNRPSDAERQALLEFVRRASGAGKLASGAAARFEAALSTQFDGDEV